MNHRIVVPDTLSLKKSLSFADVLANRVPTQSFEFDFGNLNFTYPFGSLRTCFAIREFREKYSNVTYSAILNDSEGTSYAKRMGFFQACGFDLGDAPGKYTGPTYLPITIVETSELIRGPLPDGDSIKILSKQLADRLLQADRDDWAELALAYAFGEIILNVVEHSRSQYIAYCAQYYPKKKRGRVGNCR